MQKFIIPVVGLSLIIATAIGVGTQNSNVVRSPSSLVAVSHQVDTAEANTRTLNWLNRKSTSLQDWMSKRGTAGGPPDFIDFYFPEKQFTLSGPIGGEIKVARDTKNLYDEYFPAGDPSSNIGTFFESGNPYIETKRGPYQWDSLEASGMNDHKLFKKVVNTLSETGIKSMRIGPNLFEVNVNDPKSWNSFIDKIEIMWMEGVTPTISLAFFPSLKQWEVKTSTGKVDYEKSYLLNTGWPKDMGLLAKGLMTNLWKRAEAVEKKLGRKVSVLINPINEPETLAGFNRQFWHGAFAQWNHPETMKYYIPSIIHIAMANVEVRIAVEETSGDRRILFVHNEAMTPVYYPSHQGGGRFAVSKFMLGDDIVLNEEFTTMKTMDLSDLKNAMKPGNEVHWALNRFIFSPWNKTEASQNDARKIIVDKFLALQKLHQNLQAKTSKTMKTDNILLLDYYYQTEFIPNEAIEKLTLSLSQDNGEELKRILGVSSDEAFVQMVRNAAVNNEGDLPPEGPKGRKLNFNFKSRSDINFKDLLSQDDSVVLERLIGLRREYHFRDGEVFQRRQKKAGLRPLKDQLYRTDHILDRLMENDGKELLEVLELKSISELAPMLKINKTNEARIVAEILNENGRQLFHELLGIERKFLLGFEPQHYARQVRAGIRYGFYQFMMEYVDALRIYAAGVGESGTPFFIFAPLLHDQLMMEYVTALKSGIYGTQYAFGPAVDTRGWAKAPLGLHYDDDHEINPSGLLKIKGNEVNFRGDETTGQEWAKQFINPLLEELK